MPWMAHPATGIHRADDALPDGTLRAVWGAGNVQSVVPYAFGALVGTHNGGVWTVVENGTAAPVSDGAGPWTAVSCVARGPFGVNHFYACTMAGATYRDGILLETDYNHAFPLLNWRGVPQGRDSTGPGSIWALCLSIEPVKLVAAARGGIFWADPPAANGPITWNRVEGLPIYDFSDVVNAENNRLAAAAYGDGKAAGVFMLRWDTSRKTMVWDPPHPSLSRDLLSNMRRTRLASSPSDSYRTIYLAAGSADDKLAALMRSDDGGKTFGDVPSVPTMGVTQANRNLSIGCSPNDPRVVAAGIRRGPWISTDAGTTWTEHGDAGSGLGRSPHLHADMYVAAFDARDPTSRTLWVASDGGVAWTDDLGESWNSTTNQSLANLEVNGTPHMALAVCPVMWSFGSPVEHGPVREVDVGLVVPDLVAISTQDNGILGFQGQTLDGWIEVAGGDGRSLDFLASGELVWGRNDTDGFRVTSWSGNGFAPTQSLGPRPCSSEDGDPLVAAVRDPRIVREDGARLWAFSIEWISRNSQALWGLWSPDGHTGWRWKSIKWPVGLYSSLGSATGRTLYLASQGGIERLNIETGVLTPLSVAGDAPPWDFIQIVAIDDHRAVAIYNKAYSGHLIQLAPSSGPARLLNDWVELDLGLAGHPEFQSVAVDSDSNLVRMWIATKGYDGFPSRVYETRDAGQTWNELAGLPPVHASSLALGPRISATERYLYLATWGRGAFQINIA